MEKMTTDALALNRPTEGSTAPPGQQTARSHEAAMASFQANIQTRAKRGIQAGMQAPMQASVKTAIQQRRAILTRAVQLQVIPQLLKRPMLHTAGPSSSIDAHVKRLASLSLHSSSNEVVDFVTGLMENGFEIERLYLDLLTPTAVMLGAFWEDDRCSFTDVTIGISHLQSAMRALRPAFVDRGAQMLPGAARAVLMPLPGEQHSFGLSMLSTFFTRAGWDTWSETVADAGELGAMVRRDWIDLVGFSISHDALLDRARQNIAQVRAASRNPNVIIMVGGLPFAEDASIATAIGADGTALDGAQAVIMAATLLKRRVGPR